MFREMLPQVFDQVSRQTTAPMTPTLSTEISTMRTLRSSLGSLLHRDYLIACSLLLAIFALM